MSSFPIWILRYFGGLLLAISLSPAASNIIRITDISQLPPGAVPAYEHIVAFDSLARFTPDGSMEVRESIKVLALGDEIRRGIFRTLPLIWHRQDGKIFNVNYEVESVLKQGVKEPYTLARSDKALTLRIGSAEQILTPGIYRYEIRYKIRNHFSRFTGWDELYWNVTGNDWNWTVDKASFKLELPDAANNLNAEGKDTRIRSVDIYTGAKGERGKRATVLPDGSIQTQAPLAAGEGLTVAYTWPRSILRDAFAPRATWPLMHMLFPTLKTSIIWLPLILALAFCLRWWRSNVTPLKLKTPPLVPLYTLPAEMTPGQLRFIMRKKYDAIAFSSDLLNVIAKRGIALVNSGESANGRSVRTASKQWISPLPDDGTQTLNSFDRQLVKNLFDRKQKINLSLPYNRSLINARSVQEQLYDDRRSLLFLKWTKPLWGCAGFTLLITLLCSIGFKKPEALLVLPGLLLLAIGLPLLMLPVKGIVRWIACHEPIGRGEFIAGLLFLVSGGMQVVGGTEILLTILSSPGLPAGYAGAQLSGIALCLIIGWKAPRYTQAGLNELAIAKGLKRYIKTAEKQRYRHLYPPEQTIAHFERLLPVALALGVDRTWASTFTQFLRAAGATSEVFHNTDWSSVRHFHDSCSRASVTKSSRSSSGDSSDSSGSGSSGGGSSGGGSGGGGGGGW